MAVLAIKKIACLSFPPTSLFQLPGHLFINVAQVFWICIPYTKPDTTTSELCVHTCSALNRLFILLLSHTTA